MNSILKASSFWLLQLCVLGQICNETRSIYREVPETYRFSYIETYEEPCIIFCSVKTRQSVNVTTRMVQRFENVTANVCCAGYVEDKNHKGNGLYCEPVCNPPCQNGYCRKPNQCACEAGYALDPLNSHVCKPLCLEGCTIPDCISTKTPQCFHNSSEPVTKIQSPVCTIPCINAKCVGPEICQCFPGYHQTSPNYCEPTSYFETCEHGTLIEPHTCLCDEGWQWKCGSCQPICEGCDHGTCISPGHCVCGTGYTMERNGCTPKCSDGCINGKCVGPEICICDSGWYKTKEGECKAHCDMNFEHGDCIGPNICECHIGYQLYVDPEISICLPNRKECAGLTSDPENCECEAPYEVKFFAENGGDCDCVGICSDLSRKCTKAICLYMDLAFDMFPPELDYDHGKDKKPDKNPVFDNTPSIKHDSITTNTTINDSETNDDYLTAPDLNYDYLSNEDEDGKQISEVNVSIDSNSGNTFTVSTNVTTEIIKFAEKDNNKEPYQSNGQNISTDIQNNGISTPSTTSKNESTVTTNTKPELIYIQEDKINIQEEPIPMKNNEFVITNTERIEIIEETNVAKTANPINVIKENKLSINLIIGVVIVGILCVFFMLGLFLKQRYSKKHSLSSPANNEDEIAVHYITKVS